jgi:hypothetical protein
VNVLYETVQAVITTISSDLYITRFYNSSSALFIDVFAPSFVGEAGYQIPHHLVRTSAMALISFRPPVRLVKVELGTAVHMRKVDSEVHAYSSNPPLPVWYSPNVVLAPCEQ